MRSEMKIEGISVELRLAEKTDSKAKAFADVSFLLGAEGVLRLCGFSVFERNGAPSVAPPARKGTNRYFEVVGLIGKIRATVDGAIVAEYERQARNPLPR